MKRIALLFLVLFGLTEGAVCVKYSCNRTVCVYSEEVLESDRLMVVPSKGLDITGLTHHCWDELKEGEYYLYRDFIMTNFVLVRVEGIVSDKRDIIDPYIDYKCTHDGKNFFTTDSSFLVTPPKDYPITPILKSEYTENKRFN